MKINEIYISAFGKLKDFTLKLDDGFTVIYGNNEDGKSTVMAFIKAMFYGTDKKLPTASISPREKYTPWSGETMAGRIFFEHSSKRYCLEREFRKSNSTDRIMLTNIDTGEEISTDSSVGIDFFGLSPAAFERSVYIGTAGSLVADSAAEGELNSKLSNIALTGDSNISFQKVFDRLDSAKNRLISKSGKAGSCIANIASYNELTEKLQITERENEQKSEISEKLELLTQSYALLSKEYQEIKALVDNESDIKNAQKLQEFLSVKAELDAINKELTLNDGTILDEMFIKKLEFAINRVERLNEKLDEYYAEREKALETIKLQKENSPQKLKEKIEAIKTEIDSKSAQISLIGSEIKNYEENLDCAENALSDMPQKNPGANITLLLISVIVAAVGAIFAQIETIVGVSFIAIGAIILILSFIFRGKNKQLEKSHVQIIEIKGKIAEAKEKFNALNEEKNSSTALLNEYSTLLASGEAILKQKQTELDEISEIIEADGVRKQAATEELLAFYGKYSDEQDIEKIKQNITTLEEKTDKQKALKLQLNYLSRDLGGISYDEAQQKLNSLSEGMDNSIENFEEVKSRADSLQEKLASIRDDIIKYQTELKSLNKSSENSEDIKKQLAVYREKIALKREFCDAAELAKGVLEESFAEVRRSFGSEIEKETLSIFSRLTNGGYKNVSISKSLEMKVESANIFGTRETEYLSEGTTDQAYLSLRLALAKLISGEEALPVFLDDSLASYDDNRTDSALSFLKDYSADNQALLFTCHSHICDAASSQKISVISPFE